MKIYQIFNCFFLAILVAGCHRETNPEPPPTPRVEGDKITIPTNAPQLGYVTVEPVQERKAAAVGLYGRLAWDDDLTVRVYSPVAGRVIAIPVEVNQRVAAGDALASLDSPDFGQALANARTAVGNLAAADKAFARAKELLAHGAAAQKDVEAAEAAYVAASAEKDRAEATLANYGGSDASTNEIYSLCSPLAGVLVEKNISPGQEIRPDLMLANAQQFINPQFVVTDPTRLWLFLDVDELIVTSLASGREVFIHTPAYPDKIFHGRLEIIGHELDPTTRTIKARCLVDNGDNLLRAEMYVTADVASSGTAGVDVPTKALFMKGKQHCVFVEIAPGQFERHEVKLGVESNGRTTVLDGISAGQCVVSEGSLLLESILEGDNS
ncbi:MAG: efflux RND transporter periplasmic adaptor subunit [Verrucomicrobiia bacterium]